MTWSPASTQTRSQTMTLHINGFWLEEAVPVNDPAFADALGKGLRALPPSWKPGK